MPEFKDHDTGAQKQKLIGDFVRSDFPTWQRGIRKVLAEFEEAARKERSLERCEEADDTKE